MSKIEQAITEWFGPRCADYEKGCPVCDAWAEYDLICSSGGFTRFEYIGEGGRLLTLYGEFKTMTQDEGRTLKVVGDQPLPHAGGHSMNDELIKAADELASAVSAWDECDCEVAIDSLVSSLQHALTFYQTAKAQAAIIELIIAQHKCVDA